MSTSNMKKILSYVVAAVFASMAVACVEEGAQLVPALNLSTDKVVLSAEGTMQKIVYEVQNVST